LAALRSVMEVLFRLRLMHPEITIVCEGRERPCWGLHCPDSRGGRENMATLRNFAINRLRAEGHANIAAGLRVGGYHRCERGNEAGAGEPAESVISRRPAFSGPLASCLLGASGRH